ncbi:MAG: hypothetical protein CMK59_13880 [Proteobacteria bacterium]|nr:hypothetical protein [Pseudomonadota bacterium]|tara:strand:- start:63 stop:482 length:420 start_codon:yes stop_codon:yes gene_type:complete
MLTSAQAREKLRELGLRATSARVGILQLMSEALHPLSHSDLVNSLDEVYGDQATVYRTLITFVKVGLIREVGRVHGSARYEVIKESSEEHRVHPHFVCSDCGSVQCLPETVVNISIDLDWQEILKKSLLQFVGQCLTCR